LSEYSEFFLNSKASIVELELLEISHSSFSQIYRIVRNATQGVTVIHEDGLEYEYIYRPVTLSLPTVRTDLDQILKVDLGDLGEIVPREIDQVRNSGNFREFPRVVYRTYRSDDLENVLNGPAVLELKTFNFTREGCSFEARAPSLNVSQTGENYSLGRFPGLRGLL
jgi:Domain of unknown function (DUF1833)